VGWHDRWPDYNLLLDPFSSLQTLGRTWSREGFCGKPGNLEREGDAAQVPRLDFMRDISAETPVLFILTAGT